MSVREGSNGAAGGGAGGSGPNPREGHAGPEPGAAGAAAAERGGCLKLGWGCLPVAALGLVLPVGYWL